MDNITDILSKSFPILDEEDFPSLIENGIIKEFHKNDVIVTEGIEGNSLYIILEGSARVELLHFGNGVEIATLASNNIFGEISFIEGVPPSASVVAKESSRVLILNRESMSALLDSNPAFTARFYRSLSTVLSARLRETTSMIPALLGDGAPSTGNNNTPRSHIVDQDMVPEYIKTAVSNFHSRLLEVERQAYDGNIETPQLQEIVDDTVNKLTSTLATAATDTVTDTDNDTDNIIGSYIFRETFPIFMRSRFIERCYTKPRGYAGDFYTIYLMYENKPQGDGPLGRALDAHALNLPIAQANRSRLDYIGTTVRNLHDEWQSNLPLPITSLASGSALELSRFSSENSPPNFEATCIDVDTEAIKFAANIAERYGAESHLHFAIDNVVRMALGRGSVKLKPQQFIYSLGLIDYLQDKLVVKLLDWIYDHLLLGGLVVLGNLHPNNPQRTFQKYILDWDLIYRNEEDLMKIFSKSKFSKEIVRTKVDTSGVQVFAECIKTI